MTDYQHNQVVPYIHSALSKKEQVADMFDDIAYRYDFLNGFLSAGIDKRWRKKALSYLKEIKPLNILDVATGTADIAMMAADMFDTEKITGIDISEGMLQMGRKKIIKAGLQQRIELLKGDSETINFNNNAFDAVTVAFGVRNFQDLEKGLSEILRVLRPGGKLVILEFSKPPAPVIRSFYNFYLKRVTPFIGKLFSKNYCAYKYLDLSIKAFPEGKNFLHILDKLGYIHTHHKPLSLGICSIYCAEK